ncbi:MAG: class I SAM-dependent RNA methyltransferase [Betaproteobacteria bacterium]|nr:class I SAM-dependent RNA methyltransferase [Betaproteobacteria bacterium]NBT67050.1 class I SAM-dependent RNA methyltransferase [Betaproteobacteria bacterium]NBY08141.1 class I SAM-dependent RNA methyltransferase [Betaproteobacteria bacterium]
MNALQLFMPCAAGVEAYLALEIARITSSKPEDMRVMRGGVMLQASWREAMRINLYSRLTQRVLIQVAHGNYANEDHIYESAQQVAWEMWFTAQDSFKIDITAQHSPLKSLNFAALRVKDAIADRFRDKTGIRPDVDTRYPIVRVHVHLTEHLATLYLDTSGEPLFKRGWREDKGDAPLKETLAAAMLVASGWSMNDPGVPSGCEQGMPVYDPCCGSGTISIEAAQIACRIAPGLLRNFGFQKLKLFDSHVWKQLQDEARAQQCAPMAPVFGSDVSFRMVDFAMRNAERAGVSDAVEFRGGDALQRMAPSERAGLMLVNPPYGERIEAAGIAGARQIAEVDDGGDFFSQLASHWKKNYSGWTAWVLTPDLKLPGRMRLKESRRVPMWNGPIECRLFKIEMVAGSKRKVAAFDATGH